MSDILKTLLLASVVGLCIVLLVLLGYAGWHDWAGWLLDEMSGWF